jgi:NAD(P)-dependent dehydrogenase (short-subunit alcohol dehydrogenase family)
VHAAAALGTLTPVPHITERDWERTLSVNVSASWRLIRTTAPLLQAAPSGRAVFLTDSHARQPVAFWGMLGAGKAAMENLVLSWADEMSGKDRPRINLFDPGIVASRMRAQAMPGEDAGTLRRPDDVSEAIVSLCLASERRHGTVVVMPAPCSA